MTHTAGRISESDTSGGILRSVAIPIRNFGVLGHDLNSVRLNKIVVSRLIQAMSILIEAVLCEL